MAWLAGALLTALAGLALLWFPLRLWLPLSEKLTDLSYDLPFAGRKSTPPEVVLISIGPKTTEAVLAAFGRVDAEAAEPNLDSLVAATREALS